MQIVKIFDDDALERADGGEMYFVQGRKTNTEGFLFDGNARL